MVARVSPLDGPAGPVDLHVHTDVSDGRHPPFRVLEDAAAAGVRVLVFTDHSEVTWSRPLLDRAAELGIRMPFPGVEVSTVHQGRRHHILAYGHGCHHTEFRRLVGAVNDRKNRRVTLALDVLRSADPRVPGVEDVRRGRLPDGRELHPHKRLLGLTQSSVVVGAALGRPAPEVRDELATAVRRVESEHPELTRSDWTYPDTLEVIRAAVEAGTVPVLAHPLWRPKDHGGPDRASLRRDIALFREHGVRAMEVASYHHARPGVDAGLLALLGELDLLRCGGSDYHANGKSWLGRYGLAEEQFAPLERLVRAARGAGDPAEQAPSHRGEAAKRVVLPLGTGTVVVRLPARAKVIGPSTPERPCPPAHAVTEQDAVRGALDCGLAPLVPVLREASAVAICLPDATRPLQVDSVLTPLLNRLHALCHPRARLRCVIAGGLHPPSGVEPVARAVKAAERPDRSDILLHDPHAGDMVELGRVPSLGPVLVNHSVATADAVLCVGAVAPHGEAGMSGGAKYLIPGVAGAATIRALHGRELTTRAIRGECDGNPFRNAIETAAGLLPAPVYGLSLVPEPCGHTRDAECGPVVPAHRRAVARFLARWRVPVPTPPGLLVVTGAGYPLDSTLYLAEGKALRLDETLVGPGTVLVIIAACDQGVGDRGFHDALLGRAATPHAEHKADQLRGLVRRARAVHLAHAGLPADVAAALGVHDHGSDCQAAVDAALASISPSAGILVLPHPNFAVWTAADRPRKGASDALCGG